MKNKQPLLWTIINSFTFINYSDYISMLLLLLIIINYCYCYYYYYYYYYYCSIVVTWLNKQVNEQMLTRSHRIPPLTTKTDIPFSTIRGSYSNSIGSYRVGVSNGCGTLYVTCIYYCILYYSHSTVVPLLLGLLVLQGLVLSLDPIPRQDPVMVSLLIDQY